MEINNKKAQLKISFNLIFAIVLIVVFIMVGVFGAKKFIQVNRDLEAADFQYAVQEEINELLGEPGSSQQESFPVPKGVEEICFENQPTGSNEYNFYSIPEGIIQHVLDGVYWAGTNPGGDKLCIPVENGEVSLLFQRTEEGLISIRKGGEFTPEEIEEREGRGSISGIGGSSGGSVGVGKISKEELLNNLPLKIGSNSLTLQNNKPFLINGDTPWGLIVHLSREDADYYLEKRSEAGFNTIATMLTAKQHSTNYPNNYYNVPPFTGEAFITQNEEYFEHADYVINSARKNGLVVLLAPSWTGWNCGDDGWCPEIKEASENDMLEWGRYIGNRYKDYDNIIWLMGGDANPSPIKNKIEKIAQGIKEYNPNAIMTFHDKRGNMAVDNWGNVDWLNLNNVYPTTLGLVEQAKRAYELSPKKPYFLIEGYYENMHSMTDTNLRSQFYWMILSGGSGHIFGNCPIWHFNAPNRVYTCPGIDWKNELDSSGTKSMGYAKNFFDSVAWNILVPDFDHKVLTSGYGTLGTLDYATAAYTSDKSMIIIYTPKQRTLKVNTNILDGNSLTAKWYNPRDGTYTTLGDIEKSNFNSFTPPSSSGPDWVLIIEEERIYYGSVPADFSDLTYAVIGDSMSNSYTDWMREFAERAGLTKEEMNINGVGGNSCASVYGQLSQVADGTDILFSTCGVNGLLGNSNNKKWYEDIYNEAKDKGISRIYMTTMPPYDSLKNNVEICNKMKSDNKWLKEFASDKDDLEVIDLWTMWYDSTGTQKTNCGWHPDKDLSNDGVHPNSKAYAMWGEEYYDVVDNYVSSLSSGAGPQTKGSNYNNLEEKSCEGVTIHWELDFEDRDLGPWDDLNDFRSDWTYSAGGNRWEYAEVAESIGDNPTKVLEIKYPFIDPSLEEKWTCWTDDQCKDSETGGQIVFPKRPDFGSGVTQLRGVGPSSNGGQWNIKVPSSNYLYVSYKIRFGEGFDPVQGGKIPGFCGGACPGGGANTDADCEWNSEKEIYEHCDGISDGFSARTMFNAERDDGYPVSTRFYVYHPDRVGADEKPVPGSSQIWNKGYDQGEWHTVVQRAAMNDLGQANGRLTAWLDGVKVTDQGGYEFRKGGATFAIDYLYFSTFFGGSDKTMCTLYEDDMKRMCRNRKIDDYAQYKYDRCAVNPNDPCSDILRYADESPYHLYAPRKDEVVHFDDFVVYSYSGSYSNGEAWPPNTENC